MVISHLHKYLFVEVPQTACTAIARELQEHYAGTKILHKHATYVDFLRQASAAEKKYFVFGGVRNPLDVAVSQYLKLKNNHKQKYTNPEVRETAGVKAFLQQYEFIQRENADFPAYFKKYKNFVFNEWYLLRHSDFDFVIRFENLQRDFSLAISKIGATLVRELPHVNPTEGKTRDYRSFYTPEIREQAIRAFGPYMREWGYTFPEEWGTVRVPLSSTIRFKTADWAAETLARGFGMSPNHLGILAPVRKLVRMVWA
jgi:Sulfotransferase family